VETWDAITSRRNVREFAERPINDEDLTRILEAGRRAPSSLVLPDADDGGRRERAAFDTGQATVQMMIAAAGADPPARRSAGAPIRRPDRQRFDEVVHRARW
jgi:nitroreductase